MHTTASVFINDDEYGLHQDYEKWLERLAPHAPIDQAGPEAGCTTAAVRTPVLDVGTGACLRQAWPTRPEAERNYQLRVMGREVVIAVTNGRLDVGTWERILCQLDG